MIEVDTKPHLKEGEYCPTRYEYVYVLETEEGCKEVLRKLKLLYEAKR